MNAGWRHVNAIRRRRRYVTIYAWNYISAIIYLSSCLALLYRKEKVRRISEGRNFRPRY